VTDPYAGLTPAERARLERFATAFEDLDPNDYAVYVGNSPGDDGIEAARELAGKVLGSGARRAAANAATKAFIEAGEQAIARRWRVSDLFLGSRGLGGSAEERAQFLTSLERAVVAVILWDDLSDEERETVAGPWARFAEQALAGV
jgi:hypothetical protein